MIWRNEQVKPDEQINALYFEDVKHDRKSQNKELIFWLPHKQIQD